MPGTEEALYKCDYYYYFKLGRAAQTDLAVVGHHAPEQSY